MAFIWVLGAVVTLGVEWTLAALWAVDWGGGSHIGNSQFALFSAVT